MAGYSGTPLPKKLGIVAESVVVLRNAPDGFHALLDPLPDDVVFAKTLRTPSNVVVLFVKTQQALLRDITAAENSVFPNGGLWIAWPKKSSKVPTDITEDTLRELLLPRGLVDNKVCAIDDVWSGLRMVWRKELRTSRPTDTLESPRRRTK